MADHRALARLGWAFGAITAAVLVSAALAVTSHADQRASESAPGFVAAAAPSASAYGFANLFQPR
ncbi:MAG TPA: hypothetical protein VGX95_12180 [Xanthobacteraceae bacterium]|jgi:hypothetical protein|nr:hypothetical protein [Xanthobacteraceae bacterium]